MLGEKLKRLRLQRGWTQRQLGEMAGVSASAIGMYEQGRRKPDSRLLARFCVLFGVSAEYFLGSGRVGSRRETELNDLIEELKAGMLGQSGLMFNGQPLSAEDVERIIDAIRVGVTVAVDKKGNGG